MPYQVTTATKKLLTLNKRIRGIAGGTSASKTISILLWLIDYAQSSRGELISVVSETFPHLKRGAIRDFQSIMEDRNYWKPQLWNKTDCIYTFETGSKIEFFSADQPGKVRGPRRDILFINEANNVSFDIYTQLEVRTKKVIWLDWNPVSEFWWYTELAPNQDHDFLTLTYLDNEALDQSIVTSIESRKGNKNWWLVYGLGQLGEVESRIYKDWLVIDEIPHEARLERYGLDFGYSNDPTALIAIYYYNGGYILDEILYQKGLTNKQIADVINNQNKALVMADSAEPKSIDEIRSYGVNILPCTKGKDSVNQGIQYVQNQRISITKRSVNTIKEYRNYLWETDKDGKIINEPIPIFNHACFAAGTLVNGKKIEDIGQLTGIKNVYEYDIAGEKIISTKTHKVITQRGIVDIDTLRYDDVIWKKTLLFMQVSGGLGIQTVKDGLLGVITVAVKRILEAKTRDFIDLSGKKKTDQFPLDFIFIILMAIPSIIQLIILGLLTAIHTLVVIGLMRKRRWLVKGLGWLYRRLLNGQKLKKVLKEDGKLVFKMSILSLMLQKLKEIVICVVKNTKLKIMDTTDFATSTVVKKHYVGLVPVYNLKTKSGMYHANGILVSNCDAIRYGLDSLKPDLDDYRPVKSKNWSIGG